MQIHKTFAKENNFAFNSKSLYCTSNPLKPLDSNQTETNVNECTLAYWMAGSSKIFLAPK